MSKQIEIPAFLLEMSQQMHQQQSPYIVEPVWQVRCKRYLVTEEGYNDHHWEIIDADSYGRALYRSDLDPRFKATLAEWLSENDHQWCSNWLFDNDIDEVCHDVSHTFDEVFIEAFIDKFNLESDHDQLPDPLKKFHLQETEEVIKTCLTEADARAFIARKQHDYPKLYTYVASMVFCPQMIQLRHWIMSLTTPEVKA
ncbi:ead/Ea22-like family protein [Shewanella xiamenensis]|uniref:ead/Ea22-like family protein n=1 Tax=Shewanella xiamenensis TaxID=332186 RepID=UPI00313CD9A2